MEAYSQESGCEIAKEEYISQDCSHSDPPKISLYDILSLALSGTRFLAFCPSPSFFSFVCEVTFENTAAATEAVGYYL